MSDSESDRDVKAPAVKWYFSEKEQELDTICPPGVDVHLPDGQYEGYCPKCKKKPESWKDWLTRAREEEKIYGAVYFNFGHGFAHPLHCANAHWWIPCSPKVYTETQMANLMTQKRAAGNPCGKINVGHFDSGLGEWVKTEAEVAYFKKHDWKVVSLTREEYFGPKVYALKLYEAAMAERDKIRKQARKLTAYAEKLKKEYGIKPKGGKGKRKGKASAGIDDDD